MNARFATTLAVAMAIAAFALGCGGDEDSASAPAPDGTTGSTQSGAEESTQSGVTDKATFLSEANAACKKQGEDLFPEADAYAEEHSSDGLPQPVQLANTVQAVVVPIFEAEIAAVRGLEAPPEDTKQVEAMLAEQQAAINEVKKLKSMKSFSVVEDRFVKVGKKLSSYGLAECSNG